MPGHIDEVEFTIFDTETTGLEPESGDRIVEIAAVRLRGEEKLATFQSLVNPERPISEAAFLVNHITAEMLEGAPAREKVLPDFLKFIQGSCLCSYNAGFDLGFLNQELRLLGLSLKEDILVVDILRMARRLLPGLERYALWFVAEELGIKDRQEHRALSDVNLALGVFNKLKKILIAKGIVDLVNFSSLFALDSRSLADIQNQKLAKIQEAMDLGVKIKIKYLSAASAEVTEREVIPKEIRKEKGRVYLVGHCCLRNEERNFRTDAILHFEIV